MGFSSQKRIVIPKADPAAFTAMLNLQAYVDKTKLTKTQHELIKIRASQINGCAFCLDMHTKEARKNGETEQRIYSLPAWRDTTFFDDKERAILALTEEITRISDKGVTDETYQIAANLFDDATLAQIIMAICSINAWNRIGISTRLHPKQDKA